MYLGPPAKTVVAAKAEVKKRKAKRGACTEALRCKLLLLTDHLLPRRVRSL